MDEMYVMHTLDEEILTVAAEPELQQEPAYQQELESLQEPQVQQEPESQHELDLPQEPEIQLEPESPQEFEIPPRTAGPTCFCPQMELAQAYVRPQPLAGIFPPAEGLHRGTAFPNLWQPYQGWQRR